MQFLNKILPCLTASLLLAIAVWLLFPYYQYYIDPDAVAYLTLAQRYATGDLARAINGYWSPWAVWLTAACIRLQMAPFAAAIFVNFLGAIGFLATAHALFVRFRIRCMGQWFLNLSLVVFLVYAVFWQSFDDLWACFFLLLILLILLQKNLLKQPAWWAATGVLAALAYYAKAYALPFFVLEIFVLGYVLGQYKKDRFRWLKMVGTTLAILLLCTAPWLYLLHEKYGFWTTGTAGSLNLSWYLVGHPYWQEGISTLLPPVYADSPSYWEDPFITNGATPSFWHSPTLLLLQIIRTGYNLLKLVQSFNELSALFLFLVTAAVALAGHPRLRTILDEKLRLVLLSMLLFPLGYLLINFEGRYLWYMVPPALLTGAWLIQKLQEILPWKRWPVLLLWSLLAFSFVAHPVLGLKSMYRSGADTYQQAMQLKALGIRGSFTSNIPSGEQTQHLLRLAYFSGNPYFTLPYPVSKNELLADMQRYQVRYYFHFFEKGGEDFQLLDPQGQPFPEAGRVTGIKVFEINNSEEKPSPASR